VILALAFAAAAAASAARPNVVFIMTDDHAAHAISAYGSRVNQTPQIDRLAREGMLFRNFFVTNSICTPSRAAILTGLYSHKNGVPVFNHIDGAQPTLPKLLQAAGYRTGLIGKWHLGSDPTGFDHWEIFPGQGLYNSPVLYTATGEKTYEGRYATDVVTDLANGEAHPVARTDACGVECRRCATNGHQLHGAHAEAGDRLVADEKEIRRRPRDHFAAHLVGRRAHHGAPGLDRRAARGRLR